MRTKITFSDDIFHLKKYLLYKNLGIMLFLKDFLKKQKFCSINIDIQI